MIDSDEFPGEAQPDSPKHVRPIGMRCRSRGRPLVQDPTGSVALKPIEL